MTEAEIKVFANATTSFFESMTGEKAVLGIPYIKEKEPLVLEYTGIIGISGERKGIIYFTTTREVLVMIITKLFGAAETDEESVKSLAGEISNTISGNAREFFGSGFQISVPVVVKGVPEDLKLPPNIPAIVLPIEWRKLTSYVVACFE